MSNHKKPLISIITPTYNHSEYISDCIKSVLDQTYFNWEQIIIDDGSSDNTYDLAVKFSQSDHRIKIFKQENKGIFLLSETYNLALSMCSGDYIAILEGDDFWYPNKLEEQVNAFLNDSSVVMVYGLAHGKVEATDRIYKTYPDFDSKILDYYNNSPNCSIFNVINSNFLPPLTFLIKKSAITKIGGFKQILPFPAVDLNTILDLSRLGPFHFINKPLGVWRISVNQTTKTRSVEILEGSRIIINNFFRSLTDTERSSIKQSSLEMEMQFKRRFIITYSRSGRFNLVRRKFKEARIQYKKSIFAFGFIEPVWKIRSIIGLIFSYFNCNVEFLAQYFGKGRFN